MHTPNSESLPGNMTPKSPSQGFSPPPPLVSRETQWQRGGEALEGDIHPLQTRCFQQEGAQTILRILGWAGWAMAAARGSCQGPRISEHRIGRLTDMAADDRLSLEVPLSKK